MSRLKLDSVEWKEFKICEHFKVINSKPYHKENLQTVEKGIPYITRTSLNNGLEAIVNEDKSYVVNKGNAISLGAENADFFYHINDFITGNKMYVIRHSKMNNYSGLFLVQAFRQSIKECGFGYGKGLTGTRFKNRIVLLPIDSNGHINWKFMEDYIKQEQKVQAQKVANYYEQRMIECGFGLLGLEDVEWKEFYLTELFDIKRGNQNNMVACRDGDIPLVSAKKIDNGYKAFISDNGKEIFEDNILTLNNDGDGGVGMAFYQPHHMALDTHVTALIPKFPIDKYSQLFLSRAITNQRDKFSHGYSINNSRLQKQKIILPADENGNPHWKYMRMFMKKIESEKISKVLEYLINTYIN